MARLIPAPECSARPARSARGCSRCASRWWGRFSRYFRAKPIHTPCSGPGGLSSRAGVVAWHELAKFTDLKVCQVLNRDLACVKESPCAIWILELSMPCQAAGGVGHLGTTLSLWDPHAPRQKLPADWIAQTSPPPFSDPTGWVAQWRGRISPSGRDEHWAIQ